MQWYWLTRSWRDRVGFNIIPKGIRLKVDVIRLLRGCSPALSYVRHDILEIALKTW